MIKPDWLIKGVQVVVRGRFKAVVESELGWPVVAIKYNTGHQVALWGISEISPVIKGD